MKKLPEIGSLINPEQFNDFQIIQDLIYYDGPILTHLQSQNGEYLMYWIDKDDKHHRWLIFSVNSADVENFPTVGPYPISTLIRQSKSFYLLDADGDILGRLAEIQLSELEYIYYDLF